jgi:hypothetical protein
MERLTKQYSAGYGLLKTNDEFCDSYCKKQMVETCNECAINEAIHKLAEYENTGLTPEVCKNYKLFEDEVIASGRDFNYILKLLKDDVKRKPMKPERLTYKALLELGWRWQCPNCMAATGENIYHPDVTGDENYCCTCGQKLDWK